MKKAVIFTSVGAKGISAKNLKIIIVCDNPMEFANWIIQALEDRILRRCRRTQ